MNAENWYPNTDAMCKRIQKQRQALGITVEELARITGRPIENILAIEKDGVFPSSLILITRLAKCLHVSTDYILFGGPEPSYKDMINALLEECDDDELLSYVTRTIYRKMYM